MRGLSRRLALHVRRSGALRGRHAGAGARCRACDPRSQASHSGPAASPILAGPVSRSNMPSHRIPPYERCVLDNGLTLVILPRHDVPLVAFNAVLRTGAVDDPPGKSGVAALTA